MRHKYKIFFIITIELGILFSLFTLKMETKKDTLLLSLQKPEELEGYIKQQEEYTITKKKKIKGEGLLSTMYFVGGKEKGEVYPLSYFKTEQKQEIPKGLKLTFQTYGSDQLLSILQNTYPFYSLKKNGFSSLEENYQATQLAILEIALRTGEAKNSDVTAKVLSIRKDKKEKNINPKVFDKAQEFVDYVDDMAKKNYNFEKRNPLFVITTLNTKRYTTHIGNYYLCGPYQLEEKNAAIKELEIVVQNQETKEEIPLQVVDKNGNEIKDIKKMEKQDFYFMLPNTGKHYKTTYKVKYKQPYVGIYEDPYGRDYFIKVYKEQEVTNSIQIDIS